MSKDTSGEARRAPRNTPGRARGGAGDRGGARRYDGAPEELGPRMGGIALRNGLILVTERHWAAAIREADGSISVASGRKVRLPGCGEAPAAGGAALSGAAAQTGAAPGAPHDAEATAVHTVGGGADVAARDTAGSAAAQRGPASAMGAAGIPLLRGLGRFGESLIVLGLVKAKLPNAELPLEGGRVAAALGASFVGTSAVRALAPKSALAQEVGTALAAFIPAVLSVKNSAISGYHGAEHKVIGGRETALRAAARAARAGGRGMSGARPGVSTGAEARAGAGAEVAPQGGAPRTGLAPQTIVAGDSAAAAKEHDRCGSNLVGPYLLATIATNLIARGRRGAKSGAKSPVASAAAGAASLGIALEALRWANKHGDSILARLMLSPGRAIQKVLTTSEPTSEQLEVGERALEELLRLENAGG